MMIRRKRLMMLSIVSDMERVQGGEEGRQGRVGRCRESVDDCRAGEDRSGGVGGRGG